MNDNMVSVIIPAYNAEKYVCRAIDSVLTQTDDNLEIIVINDGSTDSTEQKCKTYQNNKHFKYVYQKNRGPASARNQGLKMATGKYCAFLDADDCFAPEMIEQMVSKAEQEKADIVICDIEIKELSGKVRYYTDFQEEGTYRNKDITEKLANGFLAKIDEKGVIRNHDWSVLRRLFNRDFLVKNSIFFNERLKNSEDCLFTYTATVCASCVCYLKKRFFYKNIRNDQSLSHKYDIEYWSHRLILISEILKTNNTHRITLSPKTWALFVFRCAISGYDNISRGLDKENKLYCYKRIKEITKMNWLLTLAN